MEFRKMVTITLYARQKKRHGCIEQTFGLYGRRWGWDDLKEEHQNMYIKSVKRTARPGWMHWDDPEGWDGEGGGRGVQDEEHM